MRKSSRALLSAAAALPIAVAAVVATPVRAGCNPCKGAVKQTACNPCAAKKAASPCNPCAAKKAKCNPCKPKKY